MTVLITLSAVGINTTTFDIYSNFDNVTPIASGISKMALLAGYYLSPVPDGATTIRVMATGTCTSYTDMPISGLTTTTTTSTATPTTTTTTTTVAPTTTTTTTTIFSFSLPQFVNSMNSCYEQVTTLIPNIIYFSDYTNLEGPYTNIDDGCSDMYDGGNLFNTNLTQLYADISENNVNYNLSIPYTHSQNGDYLIECNYTNPSIDGYIASGTDYFGTGSTYFTNMYPGMFILAANNINITEFSITGSLGSDGDATNAVYIATAHPGWTAYVKTNVDNALEDPSINHIILIHGDISGVTQLYDNLGEYDDHCIQGLNSDNLTIITIVVATEQGTPGLTEEQALNIANKTLDIYNDVACDTEQTIEITFDDIANADVLVSGSASNVADWNTFFDLPTFGTPFTSVSISGNIVSLIGATNITIKNELFYFNNGSQDSVLEIVDISGVVTVLEGGAFLDCYALNYVILNGVITAGDSAFNSCNSINTLKLPLLQTAGDYCFVSIDGVPNYNFPNLVTAGTFTFAGSGVQFLLPKLVSIGNYGFNNTMPIYNIYLPSLENMGNTTGYDHVFDSIAGQNITLTIPAALMTCNGGLPDGDIQYLQANNSVTIITT